MLDRFSSPTLALLAGLFFAVDDAAAGTISLRWDPAPGASGYRIHYGTQSGQYDRTLDVGLATEAVVSELADCTTHYLAVTAYNAHGESAFSNEIAGWPRPRIASTEPQVALDGRHVSLRLAGENFRAGAALALDTSAFPPSEEGEPAVQLESLSVLGCHAIEAQLVFDATPAPLASRELSLKVLDPQGAVSLPRSFAVLAALPQSSAPVVTVDSQQPAEGWGTHAVDGDPDTNWVTQWMPTSALLPHEIEIDLRGPYTLDAFSYLPRQTGSTNGTIKEYELATSMDRLEWQPVAGGILVQDGTDRSEQPVRFSATRARFVRLRALSEVSGGPWTSAAELTLAGLEHAIPPHSEIQSPSTDAVLYRGGLAHFGGMGYPVEGPSDVTFAWTFPECATIRSSIDPTPGWIRFDCPPGDYAATWQVCDDLGLCTSIRRRISVLDPACVPLPSAALSLVSADSQELLVEDGAAVNAIDGDPTTHWVTQWGLANDHPHPHAIVVTLPEQRELCAVSYLPRQDGGTNGTIRQFQLDVGSSPASWTNVGSGVLVDDLVDKSQRVIAFPPTWGRRVRLRTLGEAHAGPYAAAAEITVYALPAPQ